MDQIYFTQTKSNQLAFSFSMGWWPSLDFLPTPFLSSVDTLHWSSENDVTPAPWEFSKENFDWNRTTDSLEKYYAYSFKTLSIHSCYLPRVAFSWKLFINGHNAHVKFTYITTPWVVCDVRQQSASWFHSNTKKSVLWLSKHSCSFCWYFIFMK